MMKRAMTAVCVCVPMSAMAEPAELSGRELAEMLPGATIQIDAPLGYKLPVRYGSDGVLAGEAGELASYLGSPTDTGKWWVRGDHVCHKWSKWLDAKLQCMRLRKEGRILHWTNQDGDKGTATLAVVAPPRPPVAAAPVQVAHAAPVQPKLIATVPDERRRDAPAEVEQQAAKPLPTTAALVAQPVRAAAPSPAPRPAAQPIQTAAGVRIMATPPLTAPPDETAPSAQAASFVVTNVRDNDVLNVRAGPSSEFQVVAALKPGSRGVAITGDCQSDWCPVRHQNAIGWVNSVYLADETSSVTKAALRLPEREAPQAAIPAKMPITHRDSVDAPRTCLTAAARALLQTIEGKFGAVKLVSTCRAGATIAGTGRPSRHASGNAVDFNAGPRKGEILRWLIANHKTGGTMTYPDMDHIHVDVGPHFVSIAGGQQTASWRNSRTPRTAAQDDDE